MEFPLEAECVLLCSWLFLMCKNLTSRNCIVDWTKTTIWKERAGCCPWEFVKEYNHVTWEINISYANLVPCTFKADVHISAVCVYILHAFYLFLFFCSIELDERTRTPKWNWMRCEKNWQLMSYNGFLIELNIPPSFFMSF